ncbi:hypothetical protein L202_05476 [Cryptococcus amylolentus CBS 6039]|uniref:Uracil-DNA glycosylase-like domain-containing protein n=1 Tax=Cryptococcus amylolentus CBS 6039 TaxID=1295533 RepID=A0A1E3HKL7_9TREE|nr:hypothetical protein L202_05476 [Cryptococcus amylolentus CBS 6039]ODN76893.1 hypothetical protein L202_05476 [Cryptococcus amylolentus CBS 6039]
MPAEDQQSASPASKAFASSLARYAYVASSSSGTTWEDTSARLKRSVPGRPPKHSNVEERKERTPKRSMSASPSKKAVKKPRGYAGPEVYEHLRPVNDLLSDDLDLVFCGINPGKQSASSGHHFAHPTNKFWRALYQSGSCLRYKKRLFSRLVTGLTSRLVPPTEDHLIIDEFNFGLTNLVDRPTSEQSELSTLEMRLNTYQLLLKFVRYHPGIVCFVGKKIWDVFESVVGKTVFYGGEVETVVKTETGMSQEGTERKVSILTPQKRPKMEATDDDCDNDIAMPSEIIATPRKGRLNSALSPSPISPRKRKGKETKIPFSFSKPQSIRLPHALSPGRQREYTYFFVVPSTSGLERTPLPEQVSNFRALKEAVDTIKQGKEPAGNYLDVDVSGVEKTVEDMRRGALLKGTVS